MKYFLHFLSTFSEIFVALLTTGGYLVLGLFLCLEGIPVIGSFIPGHVVVIAAGFLARLGILNLWIVLVVSTVATVVGDITGFLLGRKFGYNVLYTFGKIFWVKAEYIDRTIEKTKKMIDTHTGKTIVFGKFSPITRPFTPFLVGASGVHIRTFWIYNLLGAFLWISGSVFLGYIFGASYHVAAQYFGKLMVAAVISILVIIWMFRIVNKRFHVFKKYELFVLILNILSLWVLAKTVQDSFSIHSFMSNFDIYINIFMAEHVTRTMASVATFISAIGSPTVFVALGFIIGGIFIARKKGRRAAIMFISMVSVSGCVSIMKMFFMRVRPQDALIALSDPSFPSGHAAAAAAFFVALAYVFVPKVESLVKRELFIVFCVVATILVGVTRIVINVHWPSDVFAGWALGIFLSTASILLVRYVSGLVVKGDK